MAPCDTRRLLRRTSAGRVKPRQRRHVPIVHCLHGRVRVAGLGVSARAALGSRPPGPQANPWSTKPGALVQRQQCSWPIRPRLKAATLRRFEVQFLLRSLHFTRVTRLHAPAHALLRRVPASASRQPHRSHGASDGSALVAAELCVRMTRSPTASQLMRAGSAACGMCMGSCRARMACEVRRLLLLQAQRAGSPQQDVATAVAGRDAAVC
jgi:hypothetical protein